MHKSCKASLRSVAKILFLNRIENLIQSHTRSGKIYTKSRIKLVHVECYSFYKGMDRSGTWFTRKGHCNR